jgi:hypothetical protein
MLISFWLSSLQSTLQRRSRTTTCRTRKQAASQHVALESLEDRQLLTVQFALPANILVTPAQPEAVAVADFNGDGHSDYRWLELVRRN